MERLVFSIGVGFLFVGVFVIMMTSYGNYVDKKLKREIKEDDNKVIGNVAMGTVIVGAALIVGSILSYYRFIVDMIFR